MTQPARQNFEKIEKIPLSQEQTEYVCKIMIMCKESANEGKMDVEMTYDGDPHLALFLIENAKDYFEHQIDESFSD